MKTTNTALALVACITAGVALAHGGATGIVKERMDGMAAMQKAVKAVTPIMRGQAEYDADAVRSFAAAVETHSGEAMTKLFPEGQAANPRKRKMRSGPIGKDLRPWRWTSKSWAKRCQRLQTTGWPQRPTAGPSDP